MEVCGALYLMALLLGGAAGAIITLVILAKH